MKVRFSSQRIFLTLSGSLQPSRCRLWVSDVFWVYVYLPDILSPALFRDNIIDYCEKINRIFVIYCKTSENDSKNNYVVLAEFSE